MCICFSSPSCGDGGSGGIMEWVFAPFQQSPHGLLPPLSFYSLLLGDASLSPKVTQAKTPLSSFARACYPGNTAIPPLLFCTHLLSSLILSTSNPPLSSAWAGHRICFWSMGMTVICESQHYTWNSSLGFQVWQVQPYVFLSYYSHLSATFISSYLFCSGKNVDLCIIMSYQLRYYDYQM